MNDRNDERWWKAEMAKDRERYLRWVRAEDLTFHIGGSIWLLSEYSGPDGDYIDSQESFAEDIAAWLTEQNRISELVLGALTRDGIVGATKAIIDAVLALETIQADKDEALKQ